MFVRFVFAFAAACFLGLYFNDGVININPALHAGRAAVKSVKQTAGEVHDAAELASLKAQDGAEKIHAATADAAASASAAAKKIGR